MKPGQLNRLQRIKTELKSAMLNRIQPAPLTRGDNPVNENRVQEASLDRIQPAPLNDNREEPTPLHAPVQHLLYTTGGGGNLFALNRLQRIKTGFKRHASIEYNRLR